MRYIVRDKATQGCDFLAWGDDQPEQAQETLDFCQKHGFADKVELITIDPAHMDAHTRQLIEGEGA